MLGLSIIMISITLAVILYIEIESNRLSKRIRRDFVEAKNYVKELKK